MRTSRINSRRILVFCRGRLYTPFIWTIFWSWCTSLFWIAIWMGGLVLLSEMVILGLVPSDFVWCEHWLEYFGLVSVFPHRAHSWVVEFQSQNRGHRNTRLCQYNVFNAILYIPCLWFLLVSAYRSSYYPPIPPSPSYATINAAFEPARSSTSCSHHLLSTHPPGLRTVYLQRSRIGRAKMYHTTVFGYMLPPPESRLLHWCLQQWVLLDTILTLLWLPPCNKLGNPVLKTSQGPSHEGGYHPRLLPE